MDNKTGVFILTGMLGIAAQVHAIPLYYTFEGSVASICDGAGAIEAAGLNRGDSLTWTFLIDTEQDATQTGNDGTISSFTDTAASDYFHAALVSGNQLDEVDGGFFNALNQIAAYNYVHNHLVDGNRGRILTGSMNNRVQLNMGVFFEDLVIGTVLSGYETAVDSNGLFSRYSANMTLTSIWGEEVSSVPEPSTLLLLGVGLAGIGVVRRGSKR
ncbi:MAG: PEP-CTERM sorting domain-containing protein [Candidatus Thiodiazotropha sp.]